MGSLLSVFHDSIGVTRPISFVALSLAYLGSAACSFQLRAKYRASCHLSSTTDWTRTMFKSTALLEAELPKRPYSDSHQPRSDGETTDTVNYRLPGE